MELPVLIFLGVTLGLVGLFQLLRPGGRGADARVRRRIREQFGAARPDRAPQALYKDLDAVNLSSAEEYALLGTGVRPPAAPWLLGWRAALERLLQEADAPLKVIHVLFISLTAAAGAALAGWWLARWPGAAAGAAAGAALPFAYLRFRGKRRRDQFVRQMPRAFELMGRVIRAGQSVPQAFQAVGDAFEEPLAGEFTRCQQQQNLGLPPEVVLQDMAKRSGVVEFRIFVMALLIQRQAGGNLSEVLDRLAALIRSRLRLRQQVRTLTAEGRLQGLTLVVLPFVMFAAMYVLNRKYAEVLLDHSALLWGTAALMTAGVLWIRKITNFEG
jgi:tight adherence protein B